MQPLDDKRPGVIAESVVAESVPADLVPAEFLALGRVSGFFGVKGWVKVFSDTQPRENITHYDSWWLKSASSTKGAGWQKHKVVQARPHGKTIIALLDGINSREAAAVLIDQEVAVPRDLLPEAQHGEYYWADLVGCKVVSVTGEEMGLVDRLFETGANDVLVVKTDEKADNGEVLIPWIVPDVITSIDVSNRQLVVDWDPDY